MLKVIGGKRYDTERAERMATHEQPDPGDVTYYAETLYRKRTGEYFLHGEGNSLSRYASNLGGGSWGSGSAIVPMPLEDAMRWAEERLTGEQYESIFGAIDDTETMVKTTLVLSAMTHDKLKRAALEAGASMSDYVTQLLGQPSAEAGRRRSEMKYMDIVSHYHSEYLAGDAINDGGAVEHLDGDNVPYVSSSPNDFVLVTSDMGAVYCQYDPQPILVGVYLPSELLGAEGFSDEFVAWMRGLSAGSRL